MTTIRDIGFILERRAEPSWLLAWLSPFIAIALTMVTGAIIFVALGFNPLHALFVFFVAPLSTASLERLALTAAPLVLIACGLCLCFRARVWNIGAEGQFIMGAIAGSLFPVFLTGWQSSLVTVLMLALGIIGGMAWAAIPAFLKSRFGASEILTSVLLVYVAQRFLEWLLRGPWRDPQSSGIAKSVSFAGGQLLPTFGGTLHLIVAFAVAAAVALAFLLANGMKGYEIKVAGLAPKAARFAGFSRGGLVWFTFLLSGGLSGLAGIAELMTTTKQLQPIIAPSSGFTAILVAFLGRLNPLGAMIAGLAIAVTQVGGEIAQATLGISHRMSQVVQGILLLYILCCDAVVHHRIALTRLPRLRLRAG
jgi:general nucleoside transport system permease protein